MNVSPSKLIGVLFTLTGALRAINGVFVEGTASGLEVGVDVLILVTGLVVLFQSRRNPPFSEYSVGISIIILALAVAVALTSLQILLHMI
ncbi:MULTISPECIES: hypothetical protein [Halomicrobium]|uniref:Uncharacterized protein n=1 Tax=Halomicrobium mukohataei TaxID=57705 RepID=A0A4D6K811_9EURY|nr:MULTISPECIES: hypothetical protein [Halomicrobium]QCD64298.1 hypothetical protein E5139_01115 [Halomicrobium mukohataei]QFR19104.1 hypothetical protein GBQ70_01115 [Halomicrobium sp. ZPS1]